MAMRAAQRVHGVVSKRYCQMSMSSILEHLSQGLKRELGIAFHTRVPGVRGLAVGAKNTISKFLPEFQPLLLRTAVLAYPV